MPKINVYLPDELAEAVRHHQLSVSAICQHALLEEIKRMNTIEATPEFATLTVQTGEDRSRTEQFRGYWVVEPSDDMHSGDAGSDAGARYGVARTAKGRVAVYIYHVNDMFDALLNDFDTIEQAVAGGLPLGIADEFRAEEGGVILRDI